MPEESAARYFYGRQSDPELALKAFELDAVDYLQKPVSV
jgi:PleD family two-component response regulator